MTDVPDGWLRHWPDPEQFMFHWMVWSNLREVCDGLGHDFPADDQMRMRRLLDLSEKPGGLAPSDERHARPRIDVP
jgi:hypothetical protein